jgi:hypothetical protein
LDTLPSPPAVTDEKKDVDVTEGAAAAAAAGALVGFVKSSVRLFWGAICRELAGAGAGAGGVARTGIGGGEVIGGEVNAAAAPPTGPRRKRAWPVRSRMLMTRRNLDTAWSAISPSGVARSARGESEETRSSRLRKPAAAASWKASCSCCSSAARLRGG